MRHGKKVHKLERPREHRKALISNLATALITHRKIRTTEAKAKALKPVIDNLITTAKKNTVSARRMASRTIKQKEILKKLFDEIAPEMIDRTSGFSRIVRIGSRKGDGAEIVLVELVGADDAGHPASKKGRKSTPSRKQKSKPAKPAKAAKAAAVETPVASEPVVEGDEAVGSEDSDTAETELTKEEAVEEKVSDGSAEAEDEEPSEEKSPDERESDEKKPE
jgi:large subunit ribosomal protein L17